jgi:hypothetical protein
MRRARGVAAVVAVAGSADRASAGTPLAVQMPGGRPEATVVPMPFVDPGKAISKA